MAKRQHAQNQARIAAAAKAAEQAAAEAAGEPPKPDGPPNGDGQPHPSVQPTNPNGPRHPWEHVDEIMSILKTAFPLLALSMEMIVDQISTRFKPSPEEDIYRLISALLADSLQQYIGRASQPTDDGLLSQATIANIARFAENLHPTGIKVSSFTASSRSSMSLTLERTQTSFENDFLKSKPTLREYVQRLQLWRDRYEALLNKKAKKSNLEAVSHWLVEFQYQKFDEIEVPGQYLKVSRCCLRFGKVLSLTSLCLQHEDNNSNFVRISHFANKFDVTRSHGVYFRRLTILGHDGSTHRFAIQVPSVRTSRREERIMQLFRMLNWSVALSSPSFDWASLTSPRPSQPSLDSHGESQAQPHLQHSHRRTARAWRPSRRE